MLAARPKRLLLCRSANFQVDYSINPWMKPGASDPQQAVRQWQQLVKTLRATGVELEVAEFAPDAPQEVIWTRDAFALIDGRIVLANFKYPVRRRETPYYQEWFAQHGFETEAASVTLEGGNMIAHGGRYYVGTGYRAEASDCEQLARQFGIEVVPLAVTSNDFFHLDLAFLSLGDATAFYYPPAFTPEAQHTLQAQIKDLHEFSEAEMKGYCANSITLGDTVIMQAGNSSFKRRLLDLGKDVREVDVSEFKNIGGGGIHCLTNVLEWE